MGRQEEYTDAVEGYTCGVKRQRAEGRRPRGIGTANSTQQKEEE